jgi:hypothetical protein
MTKIRKPVRAVDDIEADTSKCAVPEPKLLPVLRKRLDASMSRKQMRDALTEAFTAAGFEIVPGSRNISRRQQPD